MKYHRLILFIALLIFSLSLWSKVRVLSICIGSYPENSGWNKLSSINDNRSIRFIYPEAISILDANATYEAVTSELSMLSKNVSFGDTVIVHFSGHGQQILTSASASEADQVDEAIVLYDAPKHKSKSYNGEKHLTDDLFGSYISSIRQKIGPTGLVIAVIDACHSNSMDKDADRLTDTYRGTDEIFGTEALSPDSIEALRDRYFADDKTSVVSSEQMAASVFIGACETHQRNYEIKIDGEGHGSLTYYFCQAVKEKGLSDINQFLSTLYTEMTNDNTMKFRGQQPNIRTSFDWVAPEQAKYIPQTTMEIPVEQSCNWKLWIEGGIYAIVILFIVLVLWKKKK